VGDFFAPRCRSKSKQLSVDESTCKEVKSVDDKPQDTEPQVEIVKVEHVRRSSRLSAQAAANAVARALQVIVKQHCSAVYFKMFVDKNAVSQTDIFCFLLQSPATIIMLLCLQLAYKRFSCHVELHL